MSDLLIAGPNNDLVISMGDLSLCKGSSAIAQDVLQRLQIFLGEWFLDNTLGVPWLQQILVKTPNFDVINSTIQNVILSTPGIIELLSYNLTYTNSNRSITVNFQAKCTTGETIQLGTSVGAAA